MWQSKKEVQVYMSTLGSTLWKRAKKKIHREFNAVFWPFLNKDVEDNRFLKEYLEKPFSSFDELVKFYGDEKRKPWSGFPDLDTSRKSLERIFSSEAIERIIKDADDICAGNLFLLGFNFIKNGEICWHYDPWSQKTFPLKYWSKIGYNTYDVSAEHFGDFMFPNEVGKHQYFSILGVAYCMTKDEKYAICFVEHLLSWIKANPHGVGVNYLLTLTVAQRLVSWVIAFNFFKDSLVFKERSFSVFMKSLYRQINFLYENMTIHWRPTNNFILAECLAISLVTKYFKEIKGAKQLERLSLNIFLEEMDKQVYQDGVSFEQSLGYQRFVIEIVLLMLLLYREEEDVYNRILQKLSGLLESLMNLMQPDGTIPLIGDVSTERMVVLGKSEFLDVRPYLSVGAVLLGRSDMKALSERFHEETYWYVGEEGYNIYKNLDISEPSYASRGFYDGGYFVMRSGWSKKDSHCVIDCGYVGLGEFGHGGHGHNDTLNITLSSLGSNFIIDSGTYIYEGSRAWRDYFRSTRAHNAVVVDGEEMGILGPGLFQIRAQPKPILYAWETNSEYDFFDGAHTGYQRLKDPVFHRRQILFIKPRFWLFRDVLYGKERHSLELFFHFSPMKVERYGRGYIAGFSNGPFLYVASLSNSVKLMDKIKEGWVSYRYGEKLEAPILSLSAETDLPVRITTLLYPVRFMEDFDEEKAILDAQKALNDFGHLFERLMV